MLTRTADGDLRWWTWAGHRTNATLKASLGSVADSAQRVDDSFVRLHTDVTRDLWKVAVAESRDRLCLPDGDDTALEGPKFSAALPPPSRSDLGRSPRGP
ncbi:hypothetical protein [Actinomadura alba]|uniref:Uncharacterized protein n=1 Tax=Actinomadura alba TaxID=406431 RepID=A0ABR7LSN7_9ACTN|nr:hypothetical protein [Actinomadura alba]MBC6467775.1 hypothetical protein [Actinomadura alba]